VEDARRQKKSREKMMRLSFVAAKPLKSLS
jgi:hypothetical protein